MAPSNIGRAVGGGRPGLFAKRTTSIAQRTTSSICLYCRLFRAHRLCPCHALYRRCACMGVIGPAPEHLGTFWTRTTLVCFPCAADWYDRLPSSSGGTCHHCALFPYRTDMRREEGEYEGAWVRVGPRTRFPPADGQAAGGRADRTSSAVCAPHRMCLPLTCRSRTDSTCHTWHLPAWRWTGKKTSIWPLMRRAGSPVCSTEQRRHGIFALSGRGGVAVRGTAAYRFSTSMASAHGIVVAHIKQHARYRRCAQVVRCLLLRTDGAGAGATPASPCTQPAAPPLGAFISGGGSLPARSRQCRHRHGLYCRVGKEAPPVLPHTPPLHTTLPG